MNAIDRLLQIIDYYHLSEADFGRKIGYENGTVIGHTKRKETIGPALLFRIKSECPEISSHWLLTGEGEMLKKKHTNVVNEPTADYTKNEYVALMDKYNKLLEKHIFLLEKHEELLLKSN